VSAWLAFGTAPAWAATDYDGDGATTADCQPLDPAVHPGAADLPDLAFEDTNCDGIDGDAAKAFFVAPGGDDGAAGTDAAPFLTISHAVAQAAADATRKAVYIRSGTYTEHVVLADGVSLYGGYQPGGGRSSDPTTIQAPVGTAETIFGSGATHVVLQLLVVHGAAATSGGATSYAIRAIAGSSLALQNVTASGGTGKDGAAGATPATVPGGSGECGGLSAGVCGATATGGAGGAGGYAGGAGGSGHPNADGDAGQPGAGPHPGTGGSGYVSDCGFMRDAGTTFLPTCTPTNVGTNGVSATVPGTAGSVGGGVAFTTTSAGATWSAPAATAGTAGTPGSGGGGGHAGKGATAYSCTGTAQTLAGGGGGGGGAGGVGGGGGGGGQNGGGSFGLYLSGSIAVVESGSLAGGTAGNGGNGGSGGGGGAGGPGGAGGHGQTASQPGCTGAAGYGGAGGAGSAGGAGGAGGGGAGGPSAGLFAVGSKFVIKPGAAVTSGTAGTGGNTGGTATKTGGDGVAAASMPAGQGNDATTDFDGDGVTDASDACPAVAAGGADANVDGCPDRASKLGDGDHDGVPDSADACPGTVTGTTDADGDGCPDPAAPAGDSGGSSAGSDGSSSSSSTTSSSSDSGATGSSAVTTVAKPTIRARSLRLVKGRLVLVLGCPAAATLGCRFAITVSRVGRHPVNVGSTKGLGTPGKTLRVGVALSRQLRALLLRHPVALRVVLRMVDAAGRSANASAKLTVHR